MIAVAAPLLKTSIYSLAFVIAHLLETDGDAHITDAEQQLLNYREYGHSAGGAGVATVQNRFSCFDP